VKCVDPPPWKKNMVVRLVLRFRFNLSGMNLVVDTDFIESLNFHVSVSGSKEFGGSLADSSSSHS